MKELRNKLNFENVTNLLDIDNSNMSPKETVVIILRSL